MSQQLRQITFSTLNTTKPPQTFKHVAQQPISIHELLSLNVNQVIDFKECLPGSVHERKLSITLRENQEVPKIIGMFVVCEDETLNELPEYIFGVRKENSYQYFDEFRYKASQKGAYNFVVGVKTPNFNNYNVTAKLILTVEGIDDFIEVQLKQQTVTPFVKCCKELANQEGQRMIKLACIKSKTKRQTKLIFRCTENMSLTLVAELLGMQGEGCNQIDVKPKTIQTGGKGMFIISAVTICPAVLTAKMYVRRVLTLRIKDTSCYFHFPLEVVFYPEGAQTANDD